MRILLYSFGKDSVSLRKDEMGYPNDIRDNKHRREELKYHSIDIPCYRHYRKKDYWRTVMWKQACLYSYLT